MAYAIARTKKLKRGNLSGSAAHVERERITPNADDKKQNLRLIDRDPEKKLDQLVLDTIGQHSQKRKIRTDAVYCVELLLTASPDYFRPEEPTRGGHYEQEKLDVWLESTQQWLADQYDDRIVRAELHLDEMTPHVHAYMVPLDEKGQLRCNHFFDGRQKMRHFQDSYFEAMQHLGLERGIQGSRAKHQDIKDFYRIVEEGRDLEPTRLTPEQTMAKAADRDRAILKKGEYERTALALAQEVRGLQQRVQELEAESFHWKQQADQLRDLPLEDVAWHLGLDRDQQGRWKGAEHIINIDGEKFYDFSPSVQKGGGGAIDLVMHVNECNYKQSVAWLHERFGSDLTQRAAAHYARVQVSPIVQEELRNQFVPPPSLEKNWLSVHNYLTQKRGLPHALVQAAHDQGLIYASERQNAVFLMRSLSGELNGALLRGTRGEKNEFMGYALGTKRTDGWFHLRLGGEPDSEIQKVVVCKSPIDVLSFAVLEMEAKKGILQDSTMYLAADSLKCLPREFLQTRPKVIAALGNDAAGSEMARTIKEMLPQTIILLPLALDWNEELRSYQALKEKQHNSGKHRGLAL